MFESHNHVNVRGTFWSVQAAAEQMVRQGHGGSIIGVASISALLGGKQQVHYTPTKAAVLSMMQSCACALAEHNIRANALLPGHTRTPMSADDLANPEKLKAVNERIPLGRVADPEDHAGPAVFLASDMSQYVVSLRRASEVRPIPELMFRRLVHNYLLMAGCMSVCSDSCIELDLQNSCNQSVFAHTHPEIDLENIPGNRFSSCIVGEPMINKPSL